MSYNVGWADILQSWFKNNTSKKKDALRYAVTTVTIPAVELNFRSIVLKGKHEKDDMNTASVEKFMLGFTFSLFVCGTNSNRDTFRDSTADTFRDNCAQS